MVYIYYIYNCTGIPWCGHLDVCLSITCTMFSLTISMSTPGTFLGMVSINYGDHAD